MPKESSRTSPRSAPPSLTSPCPVMSKLIPLGHEHILHSFSTLERDISVHTSSVRTRVTHIDGVSAYQEPTIKAISKDHTSTRDSILLTSIRYLGGFKSVSEIRSSIPPKMPSVSLEYPTQPFSKVNRYDSRGSYFQAYFLYTASIDFSLLKQRIPWRRSIRSSTRRRYCKYPSQYRTHPSP